MGFCIMSADTRANPVTGAWEPVFSGDVGVPGPEVEEVIVSWRELDELIRQAMYVGAMCGNRADSMTDAQDGPWAKARVGADAAVKTVMASLRPLSV